MSTTYAGGGDPTKVTGRRVLAFFLDGIVQLATFGLVFSLLHLEVEVSGTPGEPLLTGPPGDVAVVMILPLLYWLGFEVITQGRLGWTPGKLLMGIRLTRRDGRPAGMWRAAVHAFMVGIAVYLGAIGLLLFWGLTAFTKTHRHPGNWLAGTWVIDSWSFGHTLVVTANGVVSGKPTAVRSAIRDVVGDAEVDLVMARTKPNQPVYDKARGTYIVWRTKDEAYFIYDKESETWSKFA